MYCVLINWMILNRPCPFIFIGWDGFIPQRIPFTYLILQRILITVGLLLDRSDQSDPPIRSVGLLSDQLQHQTCQTDWSDRSDQLMTILAINTRACAPAPSTTWACGHGDADTRGESGQSGGQYRCGYGSDRVLRRRKEITPTC